MKLAKCLLILWILLLTLSACDGYKETQQRRNFMMPQKADLPRNKKYSPINQKKTSNNTKKTQKKSKR
jgi:hypothetical protein